MRSLLAVLCCLSSSSAQLTWTQHSLSLSGELVLTDLHAIVTGTGQDPSILALASGEAGVLLQLHSSESAVGGNWSTALDQSFPWYWYGVYAFSASDWLLSGFYDGTGASYGIIQYTHDAGLTWDNDTVVDAKQWAGGPIEFAGTQQGYMPSTSGESAWITSSGGLSFSSWKEVDPSPGNWHAGPYVFDGNGVVRITGSSGEGPCLRPPCAFLPPTL